MSETMAVESRAGSAIATNATRKIDVIGAKKPCSFMGETRQDYHEPSSRVEKVRRCALPKLFSERRGHIRSGRGDKFECRRWNKHARLFRVICHNAVAVRLEHFRSEEHTSELQSL